MRKRFAVELYKRMLTNENIFLVVGDLGYGLFDQIKMYMPHRFINTGAAEQSMMGVAVGLALSGKTVFVYSITPFLLWRTAETIRNYINHESVPVKLVGSGRDDDYKHDGFSHWAGDDEGLMKLFPNVKCLWPASEVQMPHIVDDMIEEKKPFYLNLRR